MPEPRPRTNWKNLDEWDGLRAVWEIWYGCNYRCSYCPYEMAQMWDSVAHMRLPAARWIDWWDDIYRRYGSVHVHLLGGEPLLFPEIDALIERVTENHFLSINSNLSLPLERLKELCSRISAERVFLGGSFHPQFTESDVFLEKMRYLRSLGFEGWCDFLAWPPHLKDLKNYKAKFEAEGVHFNVQVFAGTYKGKTYPLSYSDEEKQLIGPHLTETLQKALDERITLGKPCGAGYVYFKALGNGDIYRCGSVIKDYRREPDFQSDRPLGNIMGPEFDLLDAPRACPEKTCPCGESMYLWEDHARKHPALRSKVVAGRNIHPPASDLI